MRFLPALAILLALAACGDDPANNPAVTGGLSITCGDVTMDGDPSACGGSRAAAATVGPAGAAPLSDTVRTPGWSIDPADPNYYVTAAPTNTFDAGAFPQSLHPVTGEPVGELIDFHLAVANAGLTERLLWFKRAIVSPEGIANTCGPGQTLQCNRYAFPGDNRYLAAGTYRLPGAYTVIWALWSGPDTATLEPFALVHVDYQVDAP